MASILGLSIPKLCTLKSITPKANALKSSASRVRALKSSTLKISGFEGYYSDG
jgi:hypothetical protein